MVKIRLTGYTKQSIRLIQLVEKQRPCGSAGVGSPHITVPEPFQVPLRLLKRVKVLTIVNLTPEHDSHVQSLTIDLVAERMRKLIHDPDHVPTAYCPQPMPSLPGVCQV
jgi:hypothetical protein